MKKKKEKQYDEDGRVIRENKSESKREREAVKAFVETLLTHSDAQYSKLPIDQRLFDALLEAKRLKGNAYRRHLSFVTRLVIEQDVENITRAYEKLDHPKRPNPAKVRRIQTYQARLMSDDPDVIAELFESFPELDIQHVRQLVRNAKKEKQQLEKQLQEQQEQQQEQQQASGQETPTAGSIKQSVAQTRSEKNLYQYLFNLET